MSRWRVVLRVRRKRLSKNGFLPENQRLDRPTAKKRFDVLERDGFACRYCGRRAPEYEIIVEHIVPRCHGGSSEPYNLVAACTECNDGKGARLLSQQVPPIPQADWVR